MVDIKYAITTLKHQKRSLNIFLSVAGLLLFIVIVEKLLSRRNIRIRISSNTMLERLKNTESKNIIDSKDPKSKKETISSDTEKKILKKLANFEDSEKFLNKDITLTSLSYQKNTNPKYLSKIIKVHKKNNFNGYINNLRINYITQKLNNDVNYRDYKISYLAEKCGYASSQVFVIAFKKETNLTPSVYIENLKNDLDNKEI